MGIWRRGIFSGINEKPKMDKMERAKWWIVWDLDEIYLI
jgi:hypothetical protein